jgi:hypothetical protein
LRSQPKGLWLDIAVNLLNPLGRVSGSDKRIKYTGHQFTGLQEGFFAQSAIGQRVIEHD